MDLSFVPGALITLMVLIILGVLVWGFILNQPPSRHGMTRFKPETEDDWSWLYAEDYERYDGDYTGYPETCRSCVHKAHSDVCFEPVHVEGSTLTCYCMDLVDEDD